MRRALLSLLIAATGAAQDQTGRLEGVVLDSASHQPVKKATVSINFTGTTRDGNRNQDPKPVTTDVSGTFAFTGLAAGPYQLTVMQQNYPQARMGGVRKTVQVSDGDAASVTVELIPGAAVSGHIFDEDGDPLSGCWVQVHPAKNFNQGVQMGHAPMTREEDGSYRLYGIPAGKYTITAQCSTTVFQPRPLSEGPDPPPSAAYPPEFYPAGSDLKSAETVELLPGTEKSGVNFQMRPMPVTHIHGTLAAGGADWHGRDNLRVQLLPLDPHSPRAFGVDAGGQVNTKDGSFEVRQVFPGSYRLFVFSQDVSASAGSTEASNRIGGMVRLDVADKPVELSLPLHNAADVSGRVEIERSNSSTNPITPSQIMVQLIPESQFGGPSLPVQVGEDGSFTVKSVLPGEWRVRLMVGRSGFLKSAWLGDNEVTGRLLDLTAGGAGPLRLVVGTNMATIRGTAPVGQTVFCARVDEDDPSEGWNGTQVDSTGQFTLPGMAPGKYRVVVVESGSLLSEEEGGQEVTVREGETVTIEIKP